MDLRRKSSKRLGGYVGGEVVAVSGCVGVGGGGHVRKDHNYKQKPRCFSVENAVQWQSLSGDTVNKMF